MESYCAVVSGRGVEWDWLTFFYNVSAEALANPVTLSHIFNIYRRACTGGISAKCQGTETVQWTNLLNGAAAEYGLTDPHYVRFRDGLIAHGVNH
jgi:hypothetical protein